MKSYILFIVESKERPFHQFTSNLSNRNSLGKSYTWNLLYRKYPASRKGVPTTRHCNITKTYQWKSYISRSYVLTVCSYHVKYAFQSESTLFSWLNVKELLARNRREIRSLSDCNWTRIHNHLVCKRTLKHLAKLAIFG